LLLTNLCQVVSNYCQPDWRDRALPAMGLGVLGIIPGSMASPGFVVSGKGLAASLNSALHGAGRTMSRKAANEKFN